MALPAPDARRVVLVGFGPTGRILKRILNDNGVEVIIVEMNIDTVTAIREQGGILFTGMPASGKFCAMRVLNMRKA